MTELIKLRMKVLDLCLRDLVREFVERALRLLLPFERGKTNTTETMHDADNQIPSDSEY